MDNFFEKLGEFIGGLLVLVFFALIFALPTMWMWNWLMPSIFGLVTINIWQAVGINFFTSILFKGNYPQK